MFLVFLISNFFTNKNPREGNWVRFSCSNSALVYVFFRIISSITITVNFFVLYSRLTFPKTPQRHPMQLEIQLRIYHQKLLKVLIKRGIGKLVLIWLIRLTWLKTVPALVLKVIFKVTSLDEFSGLKFRFSEKATKLEKNLPLVLTFTQ